MRIIIHGGMHKTGTTSLQHILAANRATLLEEGIWYPGPDAQHHRMLNVKDNDWTPIVCINSLQEAKQNGSETVILSGEVVSTFSSEQFHRLTTCFSEHELTYLFCFRHWWDYFPSRWSQNCSRRDTQTLDAYVRAVMRSESEHADYRFDLVIARAASSGSCRVAAVSYDNAMVVDGSVLPAMLQAAGLPRDLIKQLDSHQTWQNTRNDPMLVELCRLLNGAIADRRKLPQDDLCRSVAEHRKVCDVFDLPSKIALLEDSVRDEMFAIIATHEARTLNTPDIHAVLKNLTLEHGSQFLNKIEGRIFLDKTPVPIEYSDLVWQDFVDLTNGLAATVIK